ncbi:hypothetical protein B0F90DRAFT_1398783 [Multifurca ochricompacta]|uniref:Uncharacterized protein n=1 Tax=Multifurca ochricompacta TaxID=376703 RepID=A0AAD4LZ15_9AGAM|nr:hypothetical protein B0F90DRAFT_1398783 [Multifurca ochricompacta]
MVSTTSVSSFLPPTFLNVTALTAHKGVSVLECWQILPGFTTSSQTGTAGASILQLGNLANASYSVIPPGFNAGFHTAPTIQWVVFISGLAHITLANSSVQAFVPGGKNGVIFAADTADVSLKGHSTNYPSKEETRAIQIPTGGIIPPHKVLYSSPCKSAQLQGRYMEGLDDLD